MGKLGRQKAQIQQNRTSVKELIKLIPPHLHHQLVSKLSIDAGIPKLKGKLLFDLIVYSLFSPIRMSLRRMAEHGTSDRFAYYSQTTLDHLAHTSIRSRLLKIDPSYFRAIYEHLYEKLGEQYESKTLLKKYRLKRYDSTMVAVFSHLLNGMKVGNSSKNKRQIKFTTELSGEGLIHMQFFSDQGHLSEDIALKEVIESRTHQKDEIVVFDAGLKSRDAFKEFDDAGIQFVTRINTRPRFQVQSQVKTTFPPFDPKFKEQLPNLAPVVEDQIVFLMKTGTIKWLEHPFRLIQIDIGEEEPLYILSNITWLDPQIIAAIYLMRWDIEKLFRFLKQEMDLTHFVSYDPNAIEVMMYCSLIAAMLVLVYKRKNQIPSYKKAKIEFLRQLDAICLLGLIDDDVGIQFIRDKLNEYVIH